MVVQWPIPNFLAQTGCHIFLPVVLCVRTELRNSKFTVRTFLGIRQPPSQMPQTKQSAKLLDLSREFYLSVNVGTVFLCLVMSKREIKRSLILNCHKIIAGFFCGIFLENWQDNFTSQRFIILHMEFTIVPYCTTSFSGCSRSIARIFQKEEGGGGVTLCQTKGTHRIVVFLPPEYCRLFA